MMHLWYLGEDTDSICDPGVLLDVVHTECPLGGGGGDSYWADNI